MRTKQRKSTPDNKELLQLLQGLQAEMNERQRSTESQIVARSKPKPKLGLKFDPPKEFGRELLQHFAAGRLCVVTESLLQQIMDALNCHRSQ